MLWLIVIYVLAGLATFVNLNWLQAYHRPLFNGAPAPRATMLGWWAYQVSAGVLWPLYWPFKFFVLPRLRDSLLAYADRQGLTLKGVDPDNPGIDHVRNALGMPGGALPAFIQPTLLEARRIGDEVELVLDVAGERKVIRSGSLFVAIGPPSAAMNVVFEHTSDPSITNLCDVPPELESEVIACLVRPSPLHDEP